MKPIEQVEKDLIERTLIFYRGDKQKVLTESLRKFETGNWRTTSIRWLEATLCQLELIRDESSNKEMVESIENSLRYYLPRPEFRSSPILANSLPFVRARELIAEFL